MRKPFHYSEPPQLLQEDFPFHAANDSINLKRENKEESPMPIAAPDTLLTRLRAEYGDALTEEILAGFAVRRPVTLRVNTLRSTRAQVTQALTDAGIAFEPVPWYDDALILPHAREDDVRALPLYEAGWVYLQGLSTMLPALLVDPQPGETILDMAAAPGGKTTQLAALSGDQALITACERDAGRAERLRFNLTRQGAGRVNVLRQDARQLDDFFSFHKILLDAPCSGSGTVLLCEGEKPRRMTPDWLRRTAQTQLALFRKAMKLLSPGRELVYSTCSILQEENEQIVRSALRDGAQLLPITHPAASCLPLLPTTLPGTLCIKPTPLYEGFFGAHFRR